MKFKGKAEIRAARHCEFIIYEAAYILEHYDEYQDSLEILEDIRGAMRDTIDKHDRRQRRRR